VRFVDRIPIYRRVGDVFIAVREADSVEFDWLVDEDDMEIVSVYVIDELEGYSGEEERKVYEYRAKP